MPRKLDNQFRLDGEIRYLSEMYFTRISKKPYVRFKIHYYKGQSTMWMQCQAYDDVATQVIDAGNGAKITIWGELIMRRKPPKAGGNWSTWIEGHLEAVKIREVEPPEEEVPEGSELPPTTEEEIPF